MLSLRIKFGSLVVEEEVGSACTYKDAKTSDEGFGRLESWFGF